jgi:hypothetical protein
MGFGLVTGFIDHSQVVATTKYNTLADSHTTNHSTLNLLSVLSLVFTIRFLATDLSQSHGDFKYHGNYSTRTVVNTHTKSTANSLNSDLWRLYDSLSSDSILHNSHSLFDTFYLLLTGHSTGTILTSKWIFSQSQSHIATDCQSVCLSVCLGVEPRLGLMTRCFFLFESYCPVHVGRPLWQEVGSVICQS